MDWLSMAVFNIVLKTTVRIPFYFRPSMWRESGGN